VNTASVLSKRPAVHSNRRRESSEIVRNSRKSLDIVCGAVPYLIDVMFCHSQIMLRSGVAEEHRLNRYSTLPFVDLIVLTHVLPTDGCRAQAKTRPHFFNDACSAWGKVEKESVSN